jgi:hypothetical protein
MQLASVDYGKLSNGLNQILKRINFDSITKGLLTWSFLTLNILMLSFV